MPTRKTRASTRKTVHRESTPKTGPAQKKFVAIILNEAFEPILKGVTSATKKEITLMIKEKFKPQFQLQHVKGLRMESILEYKTAPHERGEQGSAARARFALKIRDDKHLYFGWILPSIESGIIGSIYSISPSPNEHQKWKPYRWRRKHVAYGTEVKKFDKKFVEALNEVSVAEWEKRVKGYQDCYTKPYKPRTRKTSSMAVASEQSMIAESNRISAEPKGGSPTDSVSTSHSSESDGHSGYNENPGSPADSVSTSHSSESDGHSGYNVFDDHNRALARLFPISDSPDPTYDAGISFRESPGPLASAPQEQRNGLTPGSNDPSISPALGMHI